MAQFQASLTDPTTQEASVILDADCLQLQITDSSNYTQFKKLTGSVAVTNTSDIVNGTGTKFTTELSPVNLVSIGGLQFSVNTISSDSFMDLTSVYPAVSAIGLDILVREQEGGHDVADFSNFLKIFVEDQADSVFVFTSFPDPIDGLQDNEELISPPSVTQNITVNFNFTTGDGVYKITLCAVPTYDNSEPYLKGDDFVFFDDLLYECINNSTSNTPDTSPSFWKVITEAELSPKYCTFIKVVRQCDLNNCADDATFEAFCTLKEHICDDDVLCKNERFLKAIKLQTIIASIENANQRGAYDDIEDMITLSKTLCNC